MGKEIERKYRLTSDDYKKEGRGILYYQGYLNSVKERTVRVRIIEDKAFLTVKGITVGVSREEYEYPIPYDDALMMLENLCERPTIKKYRYKINYKGFCWEVDEFLNENKGLLVAEIELKHEDQEFPLPPWIGEEITSDPRYYNANLVKHPFSEWEENI
jgi:adenylate cyclase